MSEICVVKQEKQILIINNPTHTVKEDIDVFI